MTTQAPSLFSIAILCDDHHDYSVTCMRESLTRLGYMIDVIAISKLSLLDNIDSYQYVIYQHGKHFSDSLPTLNAFSGLLLVIYQFETPSLSSLRNYHHAHGLARHREEERQLFALWVQKNADRVFWLADSQSTADDLIGWGVADTIASPAILPPFMAFRDGVHAMQHTYNKECLLLLSYVV